MGYGLENQVLNFINYYEPKMSVLESINSHPDRAHNDILDTVLTSGLFGLVSYLFLLISIFYIGLKQVFKNKDYFIKITSLCVLTGLVGYLTSLQFSFHIITTSVYFWAFFAIILSIEKLKA